MEQISTRRAETKDLPVIHDLVMELAVYEKAGHEFTATLEDYQKNFEAGVFEVIVAEKKQEVVGMVLYYLTYSTWKGRMLYLEDFVVRSAFRRLGIGQILFDAFLERAKALDCTMTKWQVLDWNEPAVKFYEKNKAIIEKEWWNAKVFFEK